jgi:hypothetical protein
MQFRDHPLMIRKSGYPNWPPVWNTTSHDKKDIPTGEAGMLEEAVMSNLIDNKVFMLMTLGGVRYMAFMAFDDIAFCSQIFYLLKDNLGRSIKEIGDLNVWHLL